MSEVAPPKDRATRERELREIVAVFLLSIVAVLTAWCGFESAKWGGEMSIAFSQASSARVAATAADSEARDARQFDLTIYAMFVETQATGDEQLATYIEDRFTPAFAVAYDAWVADGSVEPSPFAREEYVPVGQVEAQELTARADEKFQLALANNQTGDNYSLLTVLFALVLFLAAISQRNQQVWGARFLLGLAAVVAIVGTGILATFPIKI